MFPQIRWRIAMSYFILVTVVMMGLAAYLSRPGCLGNPVCVRQAVSGAAVLLIIATAVLAFPVAARTTRPIRQLTQVIQRIAAGSGTPGCCRKPETNWASSSSLSTT